MPPHATTEELVTETLPLKTTAGRPQPAFRLTVVAGPDAGRGFVVDGAAPPRTLVGSGPTAHFRLTDPTVSRRHVELWLADGGLGIEDAASTNGTRIGALRVREAVLEGGETIAIGSTTLAVERLSTTAVVVVPRVASFGRIVGASVVMRRLYVQLAQLAHRDAPVLIEGEAGTGKELVAEVLHEEGPRSAQELYVFDPTDVDPERIESELFGTRDTPGAFERCVGGTLVLAELVELPMTAQTKIARLLEGRSIDRADRSPFEMGDVRVIALSRTNVDHEVDEGRVHEGLATLLGAARVAVPPLRVRQGDVTVLATTFFRSLEIEDRVLSPLTLKRFEAYAWPGNVRELRKAVVRAARSGDDEADPALAFRGAGRALSPSEVVERVLAAELALPKARAIVIEDFERRFLARVLHEHGGNVSRAAAASGLARRYFQILRSKHGV